MEMAIRYFPIIKPRFVGRRVSHYACVTRKRAKNRFHPSLIYISLIAVIPSDSLSSAASADVLLSAAPGCRNRGEGRRRRGGGTGTNSQREIMYVT